MSCVATKVLRCLVMGHSADSSFTVTVHRDDVDENVTTADTRITSVMDLKRRLWDHILLDTSIVPRDKHEMSHQSLRLFRVNDPSSLTLSDHRIHPQSLHWVLTDPLTANPVDRVLLPALQSIVGADSVSLLDDPLQDIHIAFPAAMAQVSAESNAKAVHVLIAFDRGEQELLVVSAVRTGPIEEDTSAKLGGAGDSKASGLVQLIQHTGYAIADDAPPRYMTVDRFGISRSSHIATSGGDFKEKLPTTPSHALPVPAYPSGGLFSFLKSTSTVSSIPPPPIPPKDYEEEEQAPPTNPFENPPIPKPTPKHPPTAIPPRRSSNVPVDAVSLLSMPPPMPSVLKSPSSESSQTNIVHQKTSISQRSSILSNEAEPVQSALSKSRSPPLEEAIPTTQQVFAPPRSTSNNAIPSVIKVPSNLPIPEVNSVLANASQVSKSSSIISSSPSNSSSSSDPPSEASPNLLSTPIPNTQPGSVASMPPKSAARPISSVPASFWAPIPTITPPPSPSPPLPGGPITQHKATTSTTSSNGSIPTLVGTVANNLRKDFSSLVNQRKQQQTTQSTTKSSHSSTPALSNSPFATALWSLVPPASSSTSNKEENASSHKPEHRRSDSTSTSNSNSSSVDARDTTDTKYAPEEGSGQKNTRQDGKEKQAQEETAPKLRMRGGFQSFAGALGGF